MVQEQVYIRKICPSTFFRCYPSNFEVNTLFESQDRLFQFCKPWRARVPVLSYSKYSLLFLPIIGTEPAISRWYYHHQCETCLIHWCDSHSYKYFGVRKNLRLMATKRVMVKGLDCGIVVREFVLQSRYYIHFWANTLGKGMNPLILPAILLGEWLWH